MTKTAMMSCKRLRQKDLVLDKNKEDGDVFDGCEGWDWEVVDEFMREPVLNPC